MGDRWMPTSASGSIGRYGTGSGTGRLVIMNSEPGTGVPSWTQRWHPGMWTRSVTLAVTLLMIVLGALSTLFLLLLGSAATPGPGKAMVWPAVLAYALLWAGLIRSLDRRRVLGWEAVTLAVAWGAAVPLPLGSVIASSIPSSSLPGPWGPVIGMATSELCIEALGVLVLAVVLQRGVRGPLHGMLLGAVIGLGDEIVESRTDTFGPDTTSTFVVDRMLAGLGGHAVLAGLCGLGIGLLLCTPPHPLTRRTLRGMAALATSLALHVVDDGSVLLVEQGQQPALGHGRTGADIVVVAVSVLIGVLAYRWALAHTPRPEPSPR